jgi:hypothetical protein
MSFFSFFFYKVREQYGGTDLGWAGGWMDGGLGWLVPVERGRWQGEIVEG